MSPQAKNFLEWEAITEDVIDVKRIYIDLAEDLVAGIMLSQIIYWFLPSTKTGKYKTTITRENYDWIAKTYDDWFEECRITRKQAISCIEKLEKLELIATKMFHFDHIKQTHIRINWEVFLPKLKELVKNYADSEFLKHYWEKIKEKDNRTKASKTLIGQTCINPKSNDASVQKGTMQVPKKDTCKSPKWADASVQKGTMQVPKKDTSYSTESTTESTTKTTTKNKEAIANATQSKKIEKDELKNMKIENDESNVIQGIIEHPNETNLELNSGLNSLAVLERSFMIDLPVQGRILKLYELVTTESTIPYIPMDYRLDFGIDTGKIKRRSANNIHNRLLALSSYISNMPVADGNFGKEAKAAGQLSTVIKIGTYTEDEVYGCAVWAVSKNWFRTDDFAGYSQSLLSILKLLPKFKHDAQNNKLVNSVTVPKFENSAQRTERINKNRDDEQISREVARKLAARGGLRPIL